VKPGNYQNAGLWSLSSAGTLGMYPGRRNNGELFRKKNAGFCGKMGKQGPRGPLLLLNQAIVYRPREEWPPDRPGRRTKPFTILMDGKKTWARKFVLSAAARLKKTRGRRRPERIKRAKSKSFCSKKIFLQAKKLIRLTLSFLFF